MASAGLHESCLYSALGFLLTSGTLLSHYDKYGQVDRSLSSCVLLEALEPKQAPSERQLHANLRLLARYHESEDHARLINGMVTEHHLQTCILVSSCPSIFLHWPIALTLD